LQKVEQGNVRGAQRAGLGNGRVYTILGALIAGVDSKMGGAVSPADRQSNSRLTPEDDCKDKKKKGPLFTSRPPRCQSPR